MKKKLFCALFALLVSVSGAFAVDLYVDGSALQTDAPPVIASGRTLVPLRAIFEALDAQVQWDPATQTANAQKGSQSVQVTVGQTTAYVNGQAHTLDVPAQLVQNRTLVPARFVSEAFDARVLWDATARAVYVLTEGHGPLVVEYLDVGQADSILLSSGGEYMLIDAGNNEDGGAVVAYLEQAGVDTLKYVVGTHAHEDHIGGMDDVLDAFPVQNVLLPNATTNTQTYRDVLDAIERNNRTITVPQVGESYPLGNAQVSVLAAQPSDELNNTSIVLKATYQNTGFLFMGDAETEVENVLLSTGAAVRSNVLKVGHHGADTSTSSAFLAAVAPEAAVISCGAGNSYGHPSPQTLARLAGTPVWRTDLNGTIVAMTDGQTCRLTATQGGAVTTQPGTPPAQPEIPPVQPEPQPGTVYVTPTGKRYHLDPDCAGKNAQPATLEQALASGLTPCRTCAD